MRTAPVRVVSIFPVYNSGAAIAYIVASILDGVRRSGVNVIHHVPASAPSARRPFICNAIPSPLKGLAYRVVPQTRIRGLVERRFLKSLGRGDVAYVWPGVSAALCQRVRETGATLVLERINCHTAVARRILDAEAAAVDAPPGHAITNEMIAEERADLLHCHYVFAPSPLVANSLRAEGVPEEKILSVSYGWGPDRIQQYQPDNSHLMAGRLRVLFVGLICLRKGVHRLLEAWKAAGVDGELILAGRVDPAFESRWGEELRAPNIRLLGFVSNISEVFRSADVFAFPSFEEGSPLVTYEAMASGLPVVVSPMGAGGIVREGEGGMILAPEDTTGWAAAFRRLAAEPALRFEMGRQAARRAAEFTWDRCAEVRLRALRNVEALS